MRVGKKKIIINKFGPWKTTRKRCFMSAYIIFQRHLMASLIKTERKKKREYDNVSDMQ